MNPCCNCNCDQGRRCPLRDTELANATPLRPEFPAPATDRAAGDDAYRARFWQVYVAIVMAFALMAGLLSCFNGAHS